MNKRVSDFEEEENAEHEAKFMGMCLFILLSFLLPSFLFCYLVFIHMYLCHPFAVVFLYFACPFL